MSAWFETQRRSTGERVLTISVEEDGARWLADELPRDDGFTRDLRAAVDRAWPEPPVDREVEVR